MSILSERRKAVTFAEKLKFIAKYDQIKKDTAKVNVSKLAAENGIFNIT